MLQISHGSLFLSGSQDYNQTLSTYWAKQAQVLPSCFVAPGSAQEVSTIVQTLVNSSCPFAIKSGGHNPFPSNNIAAPGITIDLSRLNSIILAQNGTNGSTITQIGPGARWEQVYDYLTPKNLMVGGGRAGDVGVGGLTVGGKLHSPAAFIAWTDLGLGGNTFFAARFGFVCDNVENFQVVLASGEIVNANSRENSDLWQVLKGGSNNFGIVTRIDLTTFQSGLIWGGIILSPETTIPDQFRAFVKFTNTVNGDTSASLITFIAYLGAKNITVVENALEYTQTVETTPPIFQDFVALPQLPDTNTLGLRNLTSLTKELEAAPGQSSLFGTLTFANDEELIAQVYNMSDNVLQPFKGTNNLYWVSMFQPLPTAIFEAGVKRGGNVLGLDRSKENQVQFLLFIQWDDDSQSKKIEKAASKLIQQISDLAKSKNQLNSWRYLNYALASQDPLGGYGSENVAKMKAASSKYDANGVFQKLVPGGYKLVNANPVS